MTAETTDHAGAASTHSAPPAPGSPLEQTGAYRGAAVLGWVLSQHRRALLLWGLAVAVVAAIYVSFYPAMGDTGELEALVEGLPDGLIAALGYDGIGTAAGYLESTVFGLLAPILLLVFALAFAARLIAGEEESGELELELTAPVGRRRVYLERAVALAIAVSWLGVVTGTVSLLLVAALDLEVAAWPLVTTTVGLILLVLAMAAISYAVGAATGRRAWALGAGAGVAVAGYMANALAPLLEDGAWLARLSPFAWYLSEDPLVHGLRGAGAAGLLVVAVVAIVVGLLAYERRDLGV